MPTELLTRSAECAVLFCDYLAKQKVFYTLSGRLIKGNTATGWADFHVSSVRANISNSAMWGYYEDACNQMPERFGQIVFAVIQPYLEARKNPPLREGGFSVL